MPKFVYEAASTSGGVSKGIVDAPTRAAAVERLLAQGRTPVRVSEDLGGASIGAFPLGNILPTFSASEDRLLILRELSTLLRAGLSVERALVVMQGLSVRPRLKSVLAQLTAALRGGQPLSTAMACASDLFPDATRKLIAAGELSGRLGEVTSRLAAGLMRTKLLRDKAVSALMYPALLVVVMLGILTVIFTVVLPRLEPLFAESGCINLCYIPPP